MKFLDQSTITNIVSLYGKSGLGLLKKELSKIFRSAKKTMRKTKTKSALITYANTFVSDRSSPLKSLEEFIVSHNIHNTIETVHILPFYPWDTDRGFSVIDYYKVKPEYGGWKDIKDLSRKVKLMFDFVANHASIENPMVQGSLIERHLDKSDPRYKKFEKYKDFTICYSEKDKPSEALLKNLARPRPTPVLTPYFVVDDGKNPTAILGSVKRQNGKVLGSGFVWTTFSRPNNSDGTEATRQVDLNFKNPLILLEVLKIISFYQSMGANLIRLDAIGYIWKKLGSTSLHEKKAHTILKIIYSILKNVYPNLTSISEINEQQDKVFKYLGTKENPESDMVYQFTHFPLAIYSIFTSDVTEYAKWYKTTKKFNGRQFVTVLGSHDGLGLKPIRNLISNQQIEKLTSFLINKNDALPNFAVLPGGKKIVYELCSTPWNLITDPNNTDDIGLKKLLVVTALGLLVKGMHAFYINGLIASENYKPKNGLDENRTVNRESFDVDKINKTLANPKSRQAQALTSILKLIQISNGNVEFDAKSPFPKILDIGNNSVFGTVLYGKRGGKIISLINVSGSKQAITLPNSLLGNKTNIIDKSKLFFEKTLTLLPYQIVWAK